MFVVDDLIGRTTLMFKEDATSSMVTPLSAITISLACLMFSCVVKGDGRPDHYFCVMLVHPFLNFSINRKHFYDIKHFHRTVMKISDEFQCLWHPPTTINLISAPCSSLVKIDCGADRFSGRNWQGTDAIVIKLCTQDHRSTNSTHVFADANQINFKSCYGESVDNF